eukprot:gb/GECG01011267.1/.p1 GENE.gb/GECG01011267.1/~~gb/GECG01011267.1/.p1  ORF type:complete len:194 (+),score=10.07 gb/GECG01011267.1/:1-582(+)
MVGSSRYSTVLLGAVLGSSSLYIQATEAVPLVMGLLRPPSRGAGGGLNSGGQILVALSGVILLCILLGLLWRRYYHQKRSVRGRVQPCAFFVDKCHCALGCCKRVAEGGPFRERNQQRRYLDTGPHAPVIGGAEPVQSSETQAHSDLGYQYSASQALNAPREASNSRNSAAREGGFGGNARPVGLFMRGARLH